ncbi:MAG: sensor domain-containing diguanylate cyclase [Cyanobacteria bacterium TGS_CYA1]|nr:sensor domain-containing diguanylate cyclase [Cyanobacteria bacterium TGS_CYA1]
MDKNPLENSVNLSEKMLSKLEVEALCKTIAEHLPAIAGCQSIGCMFFDNDMESFSDCLAAGKNPETMEKLMADFADDPDLLDLKEGELSEQQLKSGQTALVMPFYDQDPQSDKELIACLVLSDFKNGTPDKDQLKNTLSQYQFATALKNAFEHTELVRENERLRNSYDEIENKTSSLEEQTRRLIHDLTARDSIRTMHVERERLVYSISNTVRSSLRLQDVLETAVKLIGTNYSLNYCHILHGNDFHSVAVYEYKSDQLPSIRDSFLSDEGQLFTQFILSQKSPTHFEQNQIDQDPDNNRFLKSLNLRSGLAVPIIMRDKVLGVLFLQDSTVFTDFSIDDISLIGSLADNLAPAIENAELHKEIETQAVTDGLTGVSNRRSFNDSLTREFDRAKRYNQELSLLVVDLDFLKKINDTYGHQIGDEAIKNIGSVLAASSRSTDITARYGGEEFCVLLPNTGAVMASELGDRLRRRINDCRIEGQDFGFNISASIGVSCFPLHAESADALFLRADEALYKAKQDGRNCVRVSSIGPDGNPLPPVTTEIASASPQTIGES